jgi:hypothetical protein
VVALAVVELAAVACSQLALLPVSCLVCSETYNRSLKIPLKLKKHYKITQHSSNMVGMLDDTMYTMEI